MEEVLYCFWVVVAWYNLSNVLEIFRLNTLVKCTGAILASGNGSSIFTLPRQIISMPTSTALLFGPVNTARAQRKWSQRQRYRSLQWKSDDQNPCNLRCAGQSKVGCLSLAQVHDPQSANALPPDILNQIKVDGRQILGCTRQTLKSLGAAVNRWRHFIENCLAKLKQHRAVVIRYDKRSFAVLGGIHLVANVVWLIDRRLQFHLK